MSTTSRQNNDSCAFFPDTINEKLTHNEELWSLNWIYIAETNPDVKIIKSTKINMLVF